MYQKGQILKGKLLTLIAVVFCLGLSTFIYNSQVLALEEETYLQEETYIRNEIIIKFKEGADKASINKKVKGKAVKELGGRPLQLVKLEKGVKLKEALKVYNNHPLVEYAEPNYIFKHTSIPKDNTFIPSDPLFQKQWFLSTVKAVEGWGFVKESNITVAILDTGIDLEHEDLKESVVLGRDFVSPRTLPQDENGHGTHVAGIVAALSNNAVGIAGVASGAKLMPVRVLDKWGYGSLDEIGQGIKWATDNGARVINISLGSPFHSHYIKDAVNYAHNKGVIIVAAAGNEKDRVFYPAAYENVIAVSATDEKDTSAQFTNYGPEIDVAAPGVNIISTLPGTYGIHSGTSMAAPQVAGLIALMLSHEPNLTESEVRARLRATVDDLGAPGFDEYYGYGRINMYKALSYPFIDILPPIMESVTVPHYSKTKTFKVIWTGADPSPGSGIDSYDVQYQVAGTSNWVDWRNDLKETAIEFTGAGDNGYYFRVRAKDKAGNIGSWVATPHKVVIDTTPPTIAEVLMPTYSTSISKTTSFPIAWSGGDQKGGSGIATYDVQYKIGGKKEWTDWKQAIKGTSANFKGDAGKTYYFRIRAKDKAGNLSKWTTVSYKTIVPYDNNSLISKRKGFSKTSTDTNSQNYRGSLRSSTKAKDEITYKFTGNEVALIASKGPGRSKAKIYIDGIYKETIDTYSKKKEPRQVVFKTSWKKEGTHKIRIVNEGTKGRTRLDIDALAVGR